jgi:formate/nitrite transporter
MPDFDAYAPAQIAERVETVGVAKATADAVSLGLLGMLAGAFISLGGVFFAVAITGSGWGFGPTRLLGGAAFSLGLILVVVAGAELFTGNNLVAMAWASGRVTFAALLRSWGLVYLANVVGAAATAWLVALANVGSLADGGVAETALSIARAKLDQPVTETFARAVLCNSLVCLAVWLSFAGRSVTDKILAVVFPITAFVACGFEHSIANWFFLPWAWMEGGGAAFGTFARAARNLAVVTIGNVVGGTLLVAGIYWLAYLSRARRARV